MKKQYNFSKRSLELLYGVHPKLVNFAKELIKISPYDFKIVEGLRTTEIQQEYYSYGRTKFIDKWGNKITKPVTKFDGIKLKSKHQKQITGYSHAFDMCFMGKTIEEIYDVEKFNALIKVARPLLKKYGVKWGGEFKKFVDMPHFELI